MKRTLFALLGLALSASAALAQPTTVNLGWSTVGWRDTVTMLGKVSPTNYTTAGFDISQLDPSVWNTKLGATKSAPDSTVALKFYVEITGTASAADTLYIGYDTSADNVTWRTACDYVATLTSGTKLFEVHVPFDARKYGGTQYGWLGQKYMRLKVHAGYEVAEYSHGVKARAIFYKASQYAVTAKSILWRNPNAWSRDSALVTFKAAGTSNVPDTTVKFDISTLNPLVFVPPDSVNATLVSPDSIWGLKAMFEVTGAQNSNGDSLYVQWDVSTDGTTWRACTATWLGLVACGSKFYEAHIPVNTKGYGGTNRGWWGEKYMRLRVRGDLSGKQLNVKPYIYHWNYF